MKRRLSRLLTRIISDLRRADSERGRKVWRAVAIRVAKVARRVVDR